MNNYALYNAALAALILPLSFFLANAKDRWRDIQRSARIAVLMTLIAYPWDFFAIQLNVWRYPADPGPTVYGVPVNDLVFMWLCTLLTSSVLIAIDRRENRSGRHSESKHAGKEHAGHDRDRASGLQ